MSNNKRLTDNELPEILKRIGRVYDIIEHNDNLEQEHFGFARAFLLAQSQILADVGDPEGLPGLAVMPDPSICARALSFPY